jgi:hypothetical protein
MPRGTSDEWLYSDWLLIARTLKNTQHDDCDTIDAFLEDIAHYRDLDEHELVEVIDYV